MAWVNEKKESMAETTKTTSKAKTKVSRDGLAAKTPNPLSRVRKMEGGPYAYAEGSRFSDEEVRAAARKGLNRS